MSGNNELIKQVEKLVPAEHVVVLGGIKYNLTPFKIREIRVVLPAIEKIFNEAGTEIEQGNFFQLALKAFDPICLIVKTVFNMTEEQVEELSVDELVEALLAVFEVNTDFFVQKVIRRLNGQQVKTPENA